MEQLKKETPKKTKAKKSGLDIAKVGLPIIRAKLSESEFKKWCEKHNYTGDLEKAFKALQEKAKNKRGK